MPTPELADSLEDTTDAVLARKDGLGELEDQE